MARRTSGTSSSTSRRALEDGLSLLAGIGAGAALMYLLDPQSGRNRRGMIVDTTRQALADAGHSVADAGHHLAERARGTAADLADDATDRAHRAGQAAEAHAHRTASQLRDYARGWIPQRFAEQDEHPYARAAGITTGGLSLLALGAGLAYLFDPARGKARRAYIGQQFTGRTNDATDYLRRKGKHIANKARGYQARATSAMHDAREATEDAVEEAMETPES